jgi:hypothetical protein
LLLLLSLLLPFVAAAQSLASDDEAALPACCRSHGKHHCSMGGHLATRDAHTRTFSDPQVSEKCPYSLPASSASLGDHHARPANGIQLELTLQYSKHVQSVVSSGLLEVYRANRQRGPPFSSIFA